jgi:hypothetical protein
MATQRRADGAPVIDDPSPEVPAVDPPRRDRASEPVPH